MTANSTSSSDAVEVSLQARPADVAVLRKLAELLKEDEVRSHLLRDIASDGTIVPDISIALGQITVALKSTASALLEIQAEFARRMQSPGVYEVRRAAEKVEKEVDQAWATVQAIFRKIARDDG